MALLPCKAAHLRSLRKVRKTQKQPLRQKTSLSITPFLIVFLMICGLPISILFLRVWMMQRVGTR